MTSLPSSCSPNRLACELIWTGERCIQIFSWFIFVILKKIVLYDAFHVGWKTWIRAWRRRCLWARESLRKPLERGPCLGRLLFPQFWILWSLIDCPLLEVALPRLIDFNIAVQSWAREPCLKRQRALRMFDFCSIRATIWLLFNQSSSLTFAWLELEIIALFLSGSWATQAGAEERTG